MAVANSIKHTDLLQIGDIMTAKHSISEITEEQLIIRNFME